MNDSLNRYCLIGSPLGHSISPLIHKRLFYMAGLNKSYVLREIPSEQFDSQIQALREWGGFSVTFPYKQRIIPFLEKLSPRAQRYGAVNTVKNEGGTLCGYNTDADGFLYALGEAGISLSGRVLLCGAGGAAVMMGCEALERGCSLTVAARSLEKAEAFTQNLKQKYPDAQVGPALLSAVQGSYDLILNATPCGMYPHAEECPLPFAVIPSAGAVFDAIYNPGETLLLRKAAEAGLKVQGGLPMLVWQAVSAQKIWNGASFDEREIKKLCKEMEEVIRKDFR